MGECVSLLSVRELRVVYGQIQATADVSFALEEGQVLALVGSNGAGKSSTLRAIMGLAPVAAGEIYLDSQPLRGVSCPDIVRRGIAYSPEGRRIFPTTSVQDNLRAGGYTRSRADTEATIREMHHVFPILEERAHQLAGSLSGGQQQMLAMARALMSRPRILLLDEPSLGLAPVMVEQIGKVVRDISCRGVAIVLAEQNARWAVTLATHVLVLENGRQVSYDTPEATLAKDRIGEAYLGG